MKATVSERGCQHRLRRSAGATLVEVIIAIVLTAIVLVSLASAVSLSTSKSADLLWQVKAVELGESYLEEILGKRFDENSPVGGIPACHSSATACGAVGPDGESRAAYDDVDDYDNIAIKYRDFYYDETTVEYVPNTEIEETINSMQEFCYHHHNEGE